MNDTENGTVNQEVDERLDELFSEKTKTPVTSEKISPENSPKAPLLRELKTIFLEIDWEINDEIMSRLVAQTEKLKETFKTEKIIVLFFQLLGSVGRYIKAKQANSHPNAIKLLYSVYANLEKVYYSPKMTEADKKNILSAEMNKFNKLKEQIAAKKAAVAAKPDVKPDVSPDQVKLPDLSRMSPNEVLSYALEEVKRVIRDELTALRTELKS
ncbi:hypothetical protein ACFL9U_15055 [Thermodesulfobacteriota bacterium]